VAIVASGAFLSACNSSTTTPTTQPTNTQSVYATMPNPPVGLTGAGSTFAAPLYTSWAATFASQYGVQINYQAVGSGTGIAYITALTVDFGASDGIMTSAQINAAQTAGGPILAIPMTMGAVPIIYNIPGVASGALKLSGPVLAGIYLKTITKWNDPAITALNPSLTLPATNITVVHRSDSSGTSNIFTTYLSQVSSTWASQIGAGNSVNWPGDLGASGSAAVAAAVQQNSGSIGYVELTYALQNNIGFAQMQNSSGNFIAPSIASTSAAADGVSIPASTLIMITNSSNAQAYPICGFTWILAYQNQTNQGKGAELVNFLWWALHNGSAYENSLNYAPLPQTALAAAETLVKSITYNGQPILPQ